MFLTKEILRDSPLWHEIEEEARTEGLAKGISEGMAKGISEGMAKGISEGMAKGISEGMAKGQAQGERRALTLILTRRFGPLPDAVEVRIAAASLETLERWISQAVVAPSLDASLE